MLFNFRFSWTSDDGIGQVLICITLDTSELGAKQTDKNPYFYLTLYFIFQLLKSVTINLSNTVNGRHLENEKDLNKQNTYCSFGFKIKGQ